jgi:rhodanese-related sulfurtransferase
MTRQANRSTKKNVTAWVWIIGIAVIALAVFAAYSALAVPTGEKALAREITVSQAAELRNQGAFILDVREPDEWAAGHIPGATLIPLGELASRLSELPQDQQIVVVCRSGNRSATGRDILLDAGFQQVTSMGGGMNSWISQGLPSVTGP